VLVVSNIDLTIDVPMMKPAAFLNSSVRDFVLNVNNDYWYMKVGYYVSLHAELLDDKVIPPSENVIDASRLPILLVRASKAGIPTSHHLITDSAKQIMSDLGFPVAVFAVNPFTQHGYKIATNRTALYKAVKSLSMNYKYVVCAQPLIGEIVTFKSIFGKCEIKEECVEEISVKVYEAFKIPICKLHVQRADGNAYLCGLEPLRMEEILPYDLRVISEEVSRFSGKAGLIGQDSMLC
jgi:hypothetical protein